MVAVTWPAPATDEPPPRVAISRLAQGLHDSLPACRAAPGGQLVHLAAKVAIDLDHDADLDQAHARQDVIDVGLVERFAAVQVLDQDAGHPRKLGQARLEGRQEQGRGEGGPAPGRARR